MKKRTSSLILTDLLTDISSHLSLRWDFMRSDGGGQVRTENNQMIEFILNFVQDKQPHNTFIVTMFVYNININLNHLLFILGVCTLSEWENIFHG